MSDPVLLLAAVLVLALVAYALLGGADYGGGLWHLLATGPTASGQRATIDHAIGPVWEANHVWLIVAVVILFSGFPRAYAYVSTYLHVPLVGVLVGIVLRGSAFVFRAYGPDDPRHERFWGRVFSIASTVTPLFLGVTVGAITEGRLPPPTATGSFTSLFLEPWVTPFTMAVGLFTLTLFAYLAAVYLTLESQDDEERDAFRVRALMAGVSVGGLAGLALVLAPAHVRTGLLGSPWAPLLHLATAVAALAALILLWMRAFWWARIAAASQVSLILTGWALTHYPFAVRPHLTIAAAAAPENVIVLVLWILAAGAVLLVPSLLYLFSIFGPRGQHDA